MNDLNSRHLADTFVSFLIVVPTLNSFHLLPRLVSSLQAQTWRSWRVLFVDGPSSRDHQEWLKSCCKADTRFSSVQQDDSEIGIFGAMNHGFSAVSSSEFLLFWGSDDWASSPNVLSDLAARLIEFIASQSIPELCVCRGRYVDATSGSFTRCAVFQPPGLLDSSDYFRAIASGFIPPHQATVFCPSSHRHIERYASDFRLAADLDFFLRLLDKRDLQVCCLELELVHMYEGGASSRQARRRLFEVYKAYRKAFGWKWFLPVFMRYFRRFVSILS